MIHPIISLVLELIQLYSYVVITTVLFSILISFGVVNRHHPMVKKISYAMYRLTEPALRPIRNLLPDLGGIDISPIFLLIGLEFLSRMILYYALRGI